MPKATNHNAIDRLLEILKHLPSKGPGLTAREIADWLGQNGYEVSKRTVERDLSELACHFPLMCNDKSAPYGWHWLPGDGPDLPCLTMAEALSLTLVEDLLRPLLPGAILESLEPRFRQARKKLTALAETNPKARWAEKVRQVSPTLPLLAPIIATGVLETVQEALLADMQLEAAYQRPDADDPQNLRLHPLGLVQRGPVTYLVATVFDYNDVRIFAVHRIREARMINQPAQRPEGFSLDDYLDHGALQFGNGKTIRLEARVSESLAVILAETPLSGDQKLQSMGKDFQLTASVCGSWQLRWWILSQGSGITVLQPIYLRQEIAELLKQSATNYLDESAVTEAQVKRTNWSETQPWLAEDMITGVPTGFSEFDIKTSGLQPGNLIILAGRPGMGKTDLALNMVYNAALLYKVPVGVFSLGMSKKLLNRRMLCSLSKIEYQHIQRGDLTENDRSKLDKMSSMLAGAPIYIEASHGLSVQELWTRARQLKIKHNLGLMVIDSLQLMHGHTAEEGSNQETSEISRSLKAMAVELQIPVVALYQLNSSLENRHDKRPRISDLRKVGSLVQDADMILSIYRDEVYNWSPGNPRLGIAELTIGKQLNGSTGTVELAFFSEFGTFESLARADREKGK